MRKDYASRLTKEDLMKGGITCITEDGMAFKGEKQINPTVNAGGYLMLNIYELDEDGNKVKYYTGNKNHYTYKSRLVGLHRAMWAWFHNEVKEGYVVDHINNQHTAIEDYHLSNLQLLTPAENLAKERDCNTKQLKCKLNKPLSFYEDKLSKYLDEYEKAKKEHNAKKCQLLRGNIANIRARIRYWLAHKEEAEALLKEKEEKENKKHIKKEKKVYVKNDLYHQVAEMKRAVINFSNKQPWGQGKELRRFIRLYNHDRDYEILKQLYTALNK